MFVKLDYKSTTALSLTLISTFYCALHVVYRFSVNLLFKIRQMTPLYEMQLLLNLL